MQPFLILLFFLLAICAQAAESNAKPAQGGAAAPRLTSVTSHPDRNFFARGSVAETTVTASGLQPQERRELLLNIYDFTRKHLVKTLKGEIRADARGSWQGKFTLPTTTYGIYYVRVSSAGLELEKLGTEPRGFFTYGVLEDPANMPDLDPWDGFLGEHCANYPWLWQRGGLGSALMPSSNRLIVASIDRTCAEGKLGRDKFWSIPTNAAAKAEFISHLKDYVAKARVLGPGRQGRRIYETQWEPNLRAPCPKSIVDIQQIAWETLHAEDPDALITAYTSSGIDLRFLRTLMELGLWKYMNAVSVHPYKGMPEEGGFIDDVRGMRRIVREYCGKDLPLFATESGLDERNTPEGDWNKLCGQLRQAIILKGEGFQLYCPFYGCDIERDRGDYGLNYNTQRPYRPYGCQVSQPRPIFGALAAFGRLTEAHFPTCCMEYLGETVLGYAFTDRADRDSALTVWDWSGHESQVELPVGRDVVEVADVMGNVTQRKTEKGQLKLKLSELPQYVLHVDPKLWGRAAQAKLRWSERRFKNANARASVGIVDFLPTFVGADSGVTVTLENRTDQLRSVVLETRIPGEPDCRKRQTLSLAPHADKTVTVAFNGFRPAPIQRYETCVRVVPDQGLAAEMKESFNFLPIPGEFTFEGCQVRIDSDAAGLSFQVTAPDTTPTNGCTGYWCWDGDALQIALAKRYLAKRTQNDLADAFYQAYSEYTVARTAHGDEVYRHITWDQKRYPTDSARLGIVSAAEVPRRVTYENGTWHYRVRIPWEFLNLSAPRRGTTVRFALECNDRVPGERELRRHECFKLKQAAPHYFGWGVLNQ